jgi:hypothetical protein
MLLRTNMFVRHKMLLDDVHITIAEIQRLEGKIEI